MPSTAQILPFEHWCADNCGGEILERRGKITRVREWKIVLDSGQTIGKLFPTSAKAQEWLDANPNRN